MCAAANSEEENGAVDIFKEPSDYYQSEKPPTFVEYHAKTGQSLALRLVGQSPLWGHLLWNAAQVVTAYLEQRAELLVKGKNILELGAGAGLPSIVCALQGARTVIVTDYPEADLITNLKYNIDHCDALEAKSRIKALGFLWGNPVTPLTECLDEPSHKFDLVIMADILFNHSEHSKLADTLCQSLKKVRDAAALVFFTPYRPWLLEKDMQFFEIAKARGLTVEKVSQTVMERVMFEDDPGDELLRRTVFGYELRWSRID